MPQWRSRRALTAFVALLLVVVAVSAVVVATGGTLPTSPTADPHHLDVPDDGAAIAPGPTTAVSDAWPQDAVIYHVFVDRFADGDQPDTQVAGTPTDADYASSLTDWMGGDISGVRERLDHVVATGANTLWLSPVTPGPSFHGYHPTDLLDVDPRFGDVEELRALVSDAQPRGVRVVYDLVLNHTSDQHPRFLDATTDCAGSSYVEWYRFTTCPDEYTAFAGLRELPQVDLDHPPARAFVLEEVLPFYLNDIGVDGFRLDHVEGPSRDFWRTMRAEIDDQWPGTLLLGEVWAQPPVIASYGDVLDAATAFPLRDRLEATFARGGDVRAVSLAIAGMLGSDGLLEPAPPVPQTYLSSHDQPRFAHLAENDRSRSALAQAALLTLPGMPTIYYGDEVGMSQSSSLPGGADFADSWFREPMPWGRGAWKGDHWRDIAHLARLRTTEPALHSGTYAEVVGSGDVWVFVRELAEDRLLVALNNGQETVLLEELLEELLETEGEGIGPGPTAAGTGIGATAAGTGTGATAAAQQPGGGWPPAAVLPLLDGATPVGRVGPVPGTAEDGHTVLPATSALVLRLPATAAGLP